jgi:hypothetical protein
MISARAPAGMREMEDSGAVAAIADFMMQAAIMVIGIPYNSEVSFSIHRTDSEFRLHFSYSVITRD